MNFGALSTLRLGQPFLFLYSCCSRVLVYQQILTNLWQKTKRKEKQRKPKHNRTDRYCQSYSPFSKNSQHLSEIYEIVAICIIIQNVKAEPLPPAASNMSQAAAFTSSGDPDKDKKVRNLKKVSEKLTKDPWFFLLVSVTGQRNSPLPLFNVFGFCSYWSEQYNIYWD